MKVILIVLLLFLSIIIYADNDQYLGTITTDGVNNKVAQIDILGAGHYDDIEILIIRDNTANNRYLIVYNTNGISVTKMEDY